MTEYQNGDEVRINATGRVVILEEINRNPNRVEDDEIWAEYDYGFGNGWIDNPEDVTLVRKAEDIPAKKLPTAKQLASAFASGVIGVSYEDGVESMSETDPDGDNAFLAYGVSDTGQRFGCRVVITDIEYTDF
jgi:hypothetical protein